MIFTKLGDMVGLHTLERNRQIQRQIETGKRQEKSICALVRIWCKFLKIQAKRWHKIFIKYFEKKTI